jgi:hypothetical protein
MSVGLNRPEEFSIPIFRAVDKIGSPFWPKNECNQRQPFMCHRQVMVRQIIRHLTEEQVPHPAQAEGVRDDTPGDLFRP